MREFIVLFIKGFIIGTGKIIPGVSGAILAIILGVYEKGLNAINNFFSDFTKNFKFLGILGIGVMSAIILVSNIIKYTLNTFYLPTMLLFIGLIIGGIPMLLSKVKYKHVNKLNIGISIIFFLIVIVLSFLRGDNQMVFENNITSYLLLIVIGIIDAATMIIPGISGTAILMLFGCYDIIINTLSNLTNLSQISENLKIIIPFSIGIFIGIISIVKMMVYLFVHFEAKTYYAIIGFALSSIFLLLAETLNDNYKTSHILVGLALLIIGYRISRKLDR